MIRRLLAGLVLLAASARAQSGPFEADSYAVDHLVPPDGARIEVGGLGFLDDGRLVVSTRRGQVWIVENALDPDPRAARFRLFAEGLHEGLGLAVAGGEIYVLERTQLSRLRDTDRDGCADRTDVIANDWGVSGNYHEFAFGLPEGADGRFYATLNVAFLDPKWWHGKSPVPSRGWAIAIEPSGKVTPVAPGFRSPCGVGRNAEGDIFVTDNQGDWMPACGLFHLVEGRFYGHPASLDWTPEYRATGRLSTDTDPPERRRAPAAVWYPYDWSRSTGNLVPDTTGGCFGPFGGQLFVAELTNGLVMRTMLEKVRGEYQGAAVLFRRGVGSANRVAFAPDGTLFVGLTNRGWGGQKPDDGIARIRYTGVLPMEIESVRLVPGGFDVGFTRPVAGGAAVAPADIAVLQYGYDWFWEYGSPERRRTERRVTSACLSADRRRLTLAIEGLAPAMVARVTLPALPSEGGPALLHREFAYTVNQLVDGPVVDEHVARRVEPPTPRERWEEGALILSHGDALDSWVGAGWTTAKEIALDETERRRLAVTAFPPESRPESDKAESPARILVNTAAEKPGDLVSRWEFGDVSLHLEFMVPEKGNSGVYLMGRYEIQILDSFGKAKPGFGDCGGIYEGWGPENRFPGRPPAFNGCRKAGEWNSLSVHFIAPRFDAEGRKVSNARFARVMLNDVLLHENVEVENPTRGALPGPETPLGPLRLQGDHGPVAFRNISIRALGAGEDGPPFTPLFDGKSLDGFRISDGGTWTVVDGAIVGTGSRSHIFSPRGDYRNFEASARIRIADGGNSGFYVRAGFGSGWPQGYEAQINSTNRDPVKTGSLYGIAPVKAMLVAPDTWFRMRVRVCDEADGTRITIRVNDVVVVDHLDREHRHARGHIAFQQHHEGSKVEIRDLRIREL